MAKAFFIVHPSESGSAIVGKTRSAQKNRLDKSGLPLPAASVVGPLSLPQKRNNHSRKEYTKQWRKEHKEHYSEWRKQYHQAHKDELNEKNKLRYLKSKEHRLKYFKGSEAHHINVNYVIYSPKELHQGTPHDLKKQRNIKKINKLAFKYLVEVYH